VQIRGQIARLRFGKTLKIVALIMQFAGE